MTDKQITDVLERVKKWPKKRQRDAAEMLLHMEAQEQDSYVLSDEQVAEVRHRLDDPNPKYVSLEAVMARFRKRRT